MCSAHSLIQVKEGEDVSDFATCSRFIPPLHFVPVALPKNTTYIEVDNCELLADGSHSLTHSLTHLLIYLFAS